MSILKALPQVEHVGWFVRTARNDGGFLVAAFGGPEHPLSDMGTTLAAVATEAINATRETGIGPDETRRQRDELLVALKAWRAQHGCGCGHSACKRCADDSDVDLVIARAEGSR